MEFDALLRRRHNVYGFESRDVPDELIRKIIRNATHIPSAGFTQDFDIIVVKSRSAIRQLAYASLQKEYNKLVEGAVHDFMANAPVMIVPCANKKRFAEKYGDPEKNARLPWWLVDAGFASLVVILSAFQEGLGATLIGALDDAKVESVLKLPSDHSIVPLAIIPIGYEDPGWRDYYLKTRKGPSYRRRKLEETVHSEKW